MKRILFSATVAALFFSSCKETPPVINFGTGNFSDTTYVATTVPAADAHQVLFEDFTGASCTNCPAAHVLLDDILSQHPGVINVTGLYIQNFIQTKPPNGAKYDFRHEHATKIANDIYGGVNALPTAGIDRVPVSGSLKIDRAFWSSAINTQLAATTPINLKVESNFDEDSKVASIKVSMVYTQAVSFPHNLCIAVVEDSLIDVQEYPSTDPVHPGADDEYDFSSVFRGMVNTAPRGDAILDSVAVKEPGRTLIRTYQFKAADSVTLNPIPTPEHCRVIAYISSTDNSDYHIVQSAQCKLK